MCPFRFVSFLVRCLWHFVVLQVCGEWTLILWFVLRVCDGFASFSLKDFDGRTRGSAFLCNTSTSGACRG